MQCNVASLNHNYHSCHLQHNLYHHRHLSYLRSTVQTQHWDLGFHNKSPLYRGDNPTHSVPSWCLCKYPWGMDIHWHVEFHWDSNTQWGRGMSHMKWCSHYSRSLQGILYNSIGRSSCYMSLMDSLGGMRCPPGSNGTLDRVLLYLVHLLLNKKHY